jgi:hypothetical protein
MFGRTAGANRKGRRASDLRVNGMQLMQCVNSPGSSLHIYKSETNLDGRHGRTQIYMTKDPYRYRRDSRDLGRVQYRSL